MPPEAGSSATFFVRLEGGFGAAGALPLLPREKAGTCGAGAVPMRRLAITEVTTLSCCTTSNTKQVAEMTAGGNSMKILGKPLDPSGQQEEEGKSPPALKPKRKQKKSLAETAIGRFFVRNFCAKSEED